MKKTIILLLITVLSIISLLFIDCSTNNSKSSSSDGNSETTTMMTSSSAGTTSSSSSSIAFLNGASSSTVTMTNSIVTIGVEGTNSSSDGVTLQSRTVYLSDFWISQNELTYAQWYEVYQWATVTAANTYTFANAGREGNDGTIGTSPTTGNTEPVTYVNWRDSIVWCNALSEKEGLTPCYTYSDSVIRDATKATACDNAVLTLTATGYRLPTEAEWEYAARGGQFGLGIPSGSTGSWYNAYSGSYIIYKVAWYNSNSESTPHAVGTLTANKLGIYDMSGNVWEWCWDWYKTIGTTAETNPTGASSGICRVFRGGSWYSDHGYCIVGYRIGYEADITFTDVGFRLARTNP